MILLNWDAELPYREYPSEAAGAFNTYAFMRGEPLRHCVYTGVMWLPYTLGGPVRPVQQGEH